VDDDEKHLIVLGVPGLGRLELLSIEELVELEVVAVVEAFGCAFASAF
jgi:hypothetical protein